MFVTYLVFVQTEEKYLDITFHRKGAGQNHIAFHADFQVMIDEIIVKFKERKVELLYEDKHPYVGARIHPLTLQISVNIRNKRRESYLFLICP